ADITKYSWNKDENEVLLALGSIFRVDSVIRGEPVWIIKLTLINQNLPEINHVQDFEPYSLNVRYPISEIYANCLFHMGNINQAVQLSERIIRANPPVSRIHAAILFNKYAN
ncbi:unnamed protein product, partial [Rotaria sp. Silwood1]